ncbi:MAG: hypothetical protein EHM48_09255 [Planctomycetaceae bacterium]|nr:MAG: hypothetical protein EHM48_09255 [Planctomycetaceae bacterium]
MDKKTKICIWIILIGLANFVAYTVIYMFIGGEALSGWVDVLPSGQHIYYLRSNTDKFSCEVSLFTFIYSGIHSCSIFLTVAAVMLAMLTLAKDRIISSMHSTVVRGRTFITILATIITFGTIIVTLCLTKQLVGKFTDARHIGQPTAASAPASPGSAGRSTTP